MQHTRAASAHERLLLVFGPVIALIATTLGLALSAWFFGWYRSPILAAAAGAVTIAAVLALALLYVQARVRQTAKRALQQAEARINGILGSAMDAIITIDESQHVVMFNRAAEEMFGWHEADAIGAPLARFIPERFRVGHVDHVRAFGETGIVSRRMGAQRIVTGLRLNGEEFPIDASISQLSADGGKFYTVILRDVTERLRADEELRRSKDELRELGAVAHQVREQEKKRLARELHDELAQALTALKMDVAWCRERTVGGDGSIETRLDRMEATLDAAVAATRRMASDLRPLMLDDLGLLPAVEWLVENFTSRTGVACKLATSGSELELDGLRATAVYRIVQESLANVAKHAQASWVEVTIRSNGSSLLIDVRDDGQGFSPQEPRKPDSYGLLGLRERASLLGGKASVASAPGQGTRIEVQLPITPAADSP